MDKCRGAWVGQMIGVCYGEPYQFQSNGRPILGEMREWEPDVVKGALRQDDVYVELTFLQAMEDHGLDITSEQAGLAFAATPYPLWHANLYGRLNIQNGIMPPMSGHPKYNRHADDIDFQIEADVFGIICPGLPQESNRLCDIFGHIMNYGDGVYGGMFVAGMYTEAFFESDDVLKVIEAGLACIPSESQYYACIRDTVRWCQEHPDDWLATWHKVEAKWNDDLDCIPGNPHNIDAKLNGAYIVMGLLYGDGDMLKTIEICTRGGQDADSSTANAGGVIGCMKGYDALGEHWTGGIPAIADQEFLGARYTFNSLAPTCWEMAGKMVERTGGRVEDDTLIIDRQSPKPPAELEQWVNEAEVIHQPLTQHEVGLWDKRFKMVEVESDFDGGYYPSDYGRSNVLAISPFNALRAAALEATLSVPAGGGALEVEVATDGQHGDYELKVYVEDTLAHESTVNTDGRMQVRRVDVSKWAGQAVVIRIEFHANDWSVESAYLKRVEVIPLPRSEE
jgi:hypothetical protein